MLAMENHCRKFCALVTASADGDDDDGDGEDGIRKEAVERGELKGPFCLLVYIQEGHRRG